MKQQQQSISISCDAHKIIVNHLQTHYAKAGGKIGKWCENVLLAQVEKETKIKKKV